MVKPQKKKGGKKDTPKEEPSQSSVEVEEPSISEPPEAEAEDDAGLTGAARKRREKKEKKEKALQALQALQISKKPSSVSESTSRSESEVPSEQPSQAQSEAPSEPPAEPKPKAVTPKAVEPAKTKVEPKPTEEEEDVGLGLTGASKKRKPRKKKGDATQSTAGQQASTPQGAKPVPSNQGLLASTPQGAKPVPRDQGLLASTPQGAKPVPRDQGLLASTPQGAKPVPSDQGLLASPSSSQLSAASATTVVTSSGSSSSLVQMAEPGATGPSWQKSQPSAGRGRGWASLPANQGQALTFMLPPQPTPVATSSRHEQYPTRAPKSLEPVLCRYKIPTKIPGGYVSARTVRVLVNYLEMDFKSLKISRYDVSFNPDRPKRMLPEVFGKVKAKYFATELIAFDQMKNCYSLNPLRNVPATERFNTTVEILDQNGKTMLFEVSMKATGIVDLANIRRYMTSRGSSLCHPTEEIQCIDVILRQGALEAYVKAGRQFFKRPAHPIDLGYGYEMWTGLFQSAIFTNKSFINIDVAHKGFPRHQSLIDALINDFNLDPTRLIEKQRGADYFTAFVKGLKVIATVVGNTPGSGQRREFVCNSLVGPPDHLTFTMSESDGRTRKMTVGDYFAKVKKGRCLKTSPQPYFDQQN